MASVGTGFSMSLDGFVAAPNHDVSQVFKWYEAGSIPVKVPMGEGEMEVHLTEASAEWYRSMIRGFGALISGRGLFEMTHGWGGRHPLDCPIFILTHRPAPEWVKELPNAPFTFVHEGIERAIEQAKAAAGEKNVAIASPSLVQQALKLGLIDEIQVDLMPVLLGDGIPLFGTLGIAPVEMEIQRVVDAPGVTHITYRIVR